MKVLDFSYTGEALANVVVKAWTDPNFKAALLNHGNQNGVRQALASFDVFLSKPVVLTEDEYEDGWEQDDDDEGVLVLPNDSRKTAPAAGKNLLETAKR